MTQKKQDNLSRHIRDVLHNHEETYVLGSWERFQQHKQRKTRARKQRLYTAVAAAVLLILAFAFARMNIDSIPVEQIADNQQMEQLDPPENESSASSSDQEEANPESPLKSNNTFVNDEMIQNNHAENLHLSNSVSDVHSETRNTLQQKSVPPSYFTNTIHQLSLHILDLISGSTQKTGSNHSFISEAERPVSREFVKAEDLRNSLNMEHKKDLVFSIAYASVMNIHDSQTNLGSGGGVYADWNFTNNVSISSGVFIAQNRLTYSGESGARLMEFSDANGPSTLTSDDLASVQLDLVNLELPLNIRYYLTNELSVSAGISSMAFLKEEYNYNFEYDQSIQVFEYTETTGLQPTTRLVTVKTTETQSEPSLERMNWAAFYTFSVGYRQDLFNRYTASFEPFVKIPAGQVTSRNMSYTSGGIQLKISF